MSKGVKRYDAQKLKAWNDGTSQGFCVVEASDYDALLAELTAAAIAYRIRGDVIAELTAERDALIRWKQTAEYWYGQYRFVKHGESPAEYPTEGKLDGWHNSYHNT